jgi:hypothetical protein
MPRIVHITSQSLTDLAFGKLVCCSESDLSAANNCTGHKQTVTGLMAVRVFKSRAYLRREK